MSHLEELGDDGQKTLRGSVKQTIFAEAFKLDRSLEVQGWSLSPGDFAAAYEKSIFPYVREANPSKLGETWDRRIALEKMFVEKTQAGNQVALQTFQTERLPRLY